MRLAAHVLLISVMAFLVGCGHKAPSPDISVNVFRDRVYPCVKVVFPDVVEYKGVDSLVSDNRTYSVYSVAMASKPYYDIKIAKRFSGLDNESWMLEPISEQYDENVRLYEITDSDDLYDRSAVVAIIQKQGGLYLRGILGAYTRPDTVYFITIDRLIQKENYVHLFSLDRWKNSTSGKKITGDMIAQVDWLFEHTEVIDCNFGERVDKIY